MSKESDLTKSMQGAPGATTEDQVQTQVQAPSGSWRPEDPFRLLVESVQDYAIFMLDRHGNVSTWNIGARRIKGYEPEEIIGRHFSCFYPEADVAAGKPQRELEIAAAEGRIEDEGWRVRKDGSRFWASVTIAALRDEAGRLAGFAKVTRDFTERMQTHENLQREIQEKVEAQNKLATSERALRKLSLHLLRIQEDERRRIGRDLHDSLGQSLSLLKMKLDMLDRAISARKIEGAKETVSESSSLAAEAIKEVRTISYLLYPPMLEETGLKSAILWYVEGFTKRSGIEVTLDADPGFGRLPRDAELAIFRVLQEGLINVHRHSESSVARIRLLRRGGVAVLEIEDQGKGIPQFEEGAQDWRGSLGVGIRGMDERMRQIGGSLEINTTGEGTKLTAMVPWGEPKAAAGASSS
ncbi:MAG TPA: PAS domain-containing sensor histidine kinase [Candidatus Acidoferrales bacterium]|nr:PAS domain-containing sensor histidine kinase [Candidatus Acidoferrales bacterium]